MCWLKGKVATMNENELKCKVNGILRQFSKSSDFFKVF